MVNQAPALIALAAGSYFVYTKYGKDLGIRYSSATTTQSIKTKARLRSSNGPLTLQSERNEEKKNAMKKKPKFKDLKKKKQSHILKKLLKMNKNKKSK